MRKHVGFVALMGVLLDGGDGYWVLGQKHLVSLALWLHTSQLPFPTAGHARPIVASQQIRPGSETLAAEAWLLELGNKTEAGEE